MELSKRLKLSNKILDNPTERYCEVYIDRIKADFGGVHISLEESRKCAIEFIYNLKNHLAKHLDAGSSLEPI